MARVKNTLTFIDAAERHLGTTGGLLSRAQIDRVCKAENVEWPHWLTSDKNHRAGRGLYTIATIAGGPSNSAPSAPAPTNKAAMMIKPRIKKIPTFQPAASAPMPVSSVAIKNDAEQILDSAQLGTAQADSFEHQSLVPTKARGYVPFGHFNTVKSVIASGIFYPSFVTGLSGNGKTMMIEQIGALLDREVIRANITEETDEDDLLGGFRLVNGNTVWQNGPVVVAMERGAVLLLDEIDLATNKIMCLQPVLEGKPIYLKKINKVVKPAKGFTVVATANTKGQGSYDGKFIGTQVLNEAFLERFPITIEQEYPSAKVEEKILVGQLGIALEDRGVTLDDFHTGKALEFTERLVAWAGGIRKSYYEDIVSEIISTRRLVHIINAFVIFDYNRKMALDLCLSRFDKTTKDQFVDLFSKIDPDLNGFIVPVEEPVKLEDAILSADGVPAPETTQNTILGKMQEEAEKVKEELVTITAAGAAEDIVQQVQQAVVSIAPEPESTFLKDMGLELNALLDALHAKNARRKDA